MKLENCGPIERLVSEESGRAVSHVYFNAEKGQLAATNGYALIVVACKPDDGDVTGLISTEAIEEWRKYRRQNRIPNMVSFHAYEKELVVEDLPTKRKNIFPRPTGQFPAFEHLVPKMKDGTPPSVTFNPDVLKTLVSAFPQDEVQGTQAKSVSLWILPEHSKFTVNSRGKRDYQPSCPTIMVKGVQDGALAIMMPVIGMGESGWNTRLPQAVIQAPPQEPSSPTTTPDTPSPTVANESPEATPKGIGKAPKEPKTPKAAKAPKTPKVPKKKPEAAAVPPAPNGHDRSEQHVS